MKIIGIQFSPISCCFIPHRLNKNIFPSNTFRKTLRLLPFGNVRDLV